MLRYTFSEDYIQKNVQVILSFNFASKSYLKTITRELRLAIRSQPLVADWNPG